MTCRFSLRVGSVRGSVWFGLVWFGLVWFGSIRFVVRFGASSDERGRYSVLRVACSVAFFAVAPVPSFLFLIIIVLVLVLVLVIASGVSNTRMNGMNGNDRRAPRATRET